MFSVFERLCDFVRSAMCRLSIGGRSQSGEHLSNIVLAQYTRHCQACFDVCAGAVTR